MRETARIQGFPDCYKFHGTRAEMLKQVGNAVPPPLARALGAQIRAAVAGGAELRDSVLPRDNETEELERELTLWFGEGELCDWEAAVVQ